MEHGILISCIVIGTLVSAFTGGVLAKVMYDTIDRGRVIPDTLAIFGALVTGCFGFIYFGLSGLLLASAGLGIGLLAAKLEAFIAKTPEMRDEPRQLGHAYAAREERRSLNTIIGAAVFFNGVIGGLVTGYLVHLQWLGVWGLLVACLCSIASIVTLTGLVFWILFLVFALIYFFKKFCQFAMATAGKLTGIV